MAKKQITGKCIGKDSKRLFVFIGSSEDHKYNPKTGWTFQPQRMQEFFDKKQWDIAKRGQNVN